MFKELERRARYLVNRDGRPYHYADPDGIKEGLMLVTHDLVIELEADDSMEVYAYDLGAPIIEVDSKGHNIGLIGSALDIKAAVAWLKPLMVLEDLSDA